VYRLLGLSALCLSGAAHGADVYLSYDSGGTPQFSDQPPPADYETVTVEPENGVHWRIPPALPKQKPAKGKPKKRRTTSGADPKRLSFGELRQKCDSARYRYHRYRGRASNSDWGKYKARLARYAERRDYWCGRALRRR